MNYFLFWVSCIGYFISISIQLHAQRKCHPFQIDDPDWSDQWYLNASEGEYDMNVLPVWESCLSGNGIVVGVVDAGVYDHEDLQINRNLSYDGFNETNNDKSHGTMVAGVISSSKNDKFGIGIAYKAQIADIRMLESPHGGHSNPSALSANCKYIDIYSASFTNFHTVQSIYPLRPAVEDHLKRGTTYGRQGKGSVYVWSTGNFGGPFSPFGCTFDGYCNNIYSIPVAGILRNLQEVSTGESCSAIMISGITSDINSRQLGIATITGTNDSTTSLNQNSAAVPMISGAIALALEANPNVTYRDVMHLIIRSARTEGFNARVKFIENGAHLKVSRTFGFGLLDTFKFIKESEKWTNVPPKQECILTFRNSQPIEPVLKSESGDCNITNLEHVELEMKFKLKNAGHIQWTLMSPMCTNSIILPGRRFDYRRTIEIKVISVHFWNETSSGNWFLMLEKTTEDDLNFLNDSYLEVNVTLHGFFSDQRKHSDGNFTSCRFTSFEDSEISPIYRRGYFSPSSVAIPLSFPMLLIINGLGAGFL